MATESAELRRQIELRTRAASQLGGKGQADARLSSTAALRVLHGLASSPATAADAIALLHELQVHQVELDMQYEESQGSNTELEANLARQTRLFDHAPVALFGIDAALGLVDLNLAGARLLGRERHALRGRGLAQFLTHTGKSALQTAMTNASAGVEGQSFALELIHGESAPVTVQASLNSDPAGPGFLLAMTRLPDR